MTGLTAGYSAFMKTLIRIVVIVLAGVCALALTGCSMLSFGQPAANSSESTSAGASASPTVNSIVVCDDLMDATRATTLLGKDVTQIDPTQRELLGAPLALELQTAGGISCVWGDETAERDEHSGVAVLTAEVLPAASVAWEKLAQASASAEEGAKYDKYTSRGGNCTATHTRSECHTNVLVGGNWLAVSAYGPDAATLWQESFHTEVQKMVAEVERMPQPEPTSSDASLSSSSLCTKPGFPDAVAKTFEVRVASNTDLELRFDIASALQLAPEVSTCAIQPSLNGTGGVFVTVETVPNGAEQYSDYRQALSHSIMVTSVTLAQSRQGIGHVSPTKGAPDQYTLDFMHGTQWTRIICADGGSAPAHTRALADWILAN